MGRAPRGPWVACVENSQHLATCAFRSWCQDCMFMMSCILGKQARTTTQTRSIRPSVGLGSNSNSGAVTPDGVQRQQGCHRNRSTMHLVNLQSTCVQIATFV